MSIDPKIVELFETAEVELDQTIKDALIGERWTYRSLLMLESKADLKDELKILKNGPANALWHEIKKRKPNGHIPNESVNKSVCGTDETMAEDQKDIETTESFNKSHVNESLSQNKNDDNSCDEETDPDDNDNLGIRDDYIIFKMCGTR